MFDFSIVNCQEVKFNEALLRDLKKRWPKEKPAYAWFQEHRPQGCLEVLYVRSPIGEVAGHFKFADSFDSWAERLSGLLTAAGLEYDLVVRFFELWTVLKNSDPQLYGWCYSNSAGPNKDRIVGFLGTTQTFLVTLSK